MCLSLSHAARLHLRELVLLRRVRDRIDREPAGPLDIEALALEVDMSAEHLARRFRLAYGLSPHGYQQAARAVRNREARAAEPAVA
ncbi:AraC family transcriptional regulator [Amycolatopsis sp. cmx-4-68]|uniref:AraC family transcriptional regulator n=1 Tax=Amycolatopsis sp. cmx-4-68 TaxID=2790938 RepID=UPI00397D903A